MFGEDIFWEFGADIFQWVLYQLSEELFLWTLLDTAFVGSLLDLNLWSQNIFNCYYVILGGEIMLEALVWLVEVALNKVWMGIVFLARNIYVKSHCIKYFILQVFSDQHFPV